MRTEYCASLAVDHDIVQSDNFEICVFNSNIFHQWKINIHTPAVLGPIQIPFKTNELYDLHEVFACAFDTLKENGWKVSGRWQIGGDVFYVDVEETDDK